MSKNKIKKLKIKRTLDVSDLKIQLEGLSYDLHFSKKRLNELLEENKKLKEELSTFNDIKKDIEGLRIDISGLTKDFETLRSDEKTSGLN